MFSAMCSLEKIEGEIGQVSTSVAPAAWFRL